MIDLQDVKDYVDETYNQHISIYDHKDYIRVTNGSAGFYADFHMSCDLMVVKGVRYSEQFNSTYEATQENIETALHDCLGL